MTNYKVNRREFLITSGKGIGALAIGAAIPGVVSANGLMKVDANNMLAYDVTPFVNIDATGAITIFNTRPDMGQGTWQSIPTIVAEELDVDPSTIKIKMSEGEKKFGGQGSGGSSSVRESYEPLRKAGAAANQMLRQAAAAKWKCDLSDTKTDNGKVIQISSNRTFTYGELAIDASKLEIPKEPKLKERSQFKYIGKETKRQDIPLKTAGKAGYGLDVEIPGMVYAVPVHSPYIHARVDTLDDTEARKVSGIIDIIRTERDNHPIKAETVTVLANNQWSAIKASRLLNIKWIKKYDDESMSTQAYFDKCKAEIEKAGNKYPESKGDFDTTYKATSNKVSAVYQTPFASHAALEPNNATAWAKGNGVELWAPIQGTDWVKQDLAQYLNTNIDNIVIHPTFMGGAFGRKAFYDYVREAVMISKKINKPVKLVWTRETDMTQGPFRPGMINAVWGSIDANGNVNSFHHKIIGESIQGQIFHADLTSKADDWALETIGFEDSPYDIPNRYHSHALVKTNIPILWWRSVYSSTNAFGQESFIDELAHAAGKDPLDLRYEMLKDQPRFTAVLKKLEEKSDYRSLRGQSGKNIGIAIARSFGSIAAQAVILSKNGNGVKIEKVVSVIDCGIPITPNNVRAQTEGNVVMGLTAAIKSDITFNQGQCDQSNYHNYQIMRYPESPEIKVYIMENDEKPGGVGEPGLPPVAPALANAIHNLTSKRIRTLPLDLNNI